MKRQERVLPADSPLWPPSLNQELVYALKGVNAGVGDSSQQTLVIRWIIWNLCRTYDLEHRPDDRDSCVAAGKRFCGLMLVDALNMSMEQVAKLPKLRPSGDGEDDEIQNT
jgi:hypothetical protein